MGTKEGTNRTGYLDLKFGLETCTDGSAVEGRDVDGVGVGCGVGCLVVIIGCLVGLLDGTDEGREVGWLVVG